MLSINNTMPQGQFQQRINNETITHNSLEFFADKTVVLFALPGAFTPTCSASHLPGFVTLADQFFDKGVDVIACLSVNDAFVMDAWGKSQNAEHIAMLADGDGSYTKLLGLGKETGTFGGYRSQRYAAVIKNGVVTHLAIENAGEFEVSSAQALLEKV
ncbi:peroxiredoxin [Thalassotalea marina]|uniref:Glutathione-dependent peroxiredoxin n=1 Tax=Thalassotalea marina TaxID=1673741 RepID=A0A919EN04_9GAMM|nr:peroxiredoxin [Thalassotalea marina]GHG00189.1 peroxiredoxin [Thalassotalea marina]